MKHSFSNLVVHLYLSLCYPSSFTLQFCTKTEGSYGCQKQSQNVCLKGPKKIKPQRFGLRNPFIECPWRVVSQSEEHQRHQQCYNVNQTSPCFWTVFFLGRNPLFPVIFKVDRLFKSTQGSGKNRENYMWSKEIQGSVWLWFIFYSCIHFFLPDGSKKWNTYNWV